MKIASSLLLCILITAIALGLAPRAYASYDIRVDEDRVHVELAVDINQNITGLVTEFDLPVNVNIRFEGQNASTAQASVQAALRQRTPTASVESLTMSVRSGPSINATPGSPGLAERIRNGQWFNVSLAFDVSGVFKTGPVTQVDLAWRAFRVDEDITYSNVSVNQIGAKYVIVPIQEQADLEISRQGQSVQTTSMAFFADRAPVRATEIGDLVSRLVVLDFTDLEAELEEWDRQLSPRLSAEWSRLSGFEIAMVATLREPEGDVSLAYFVRSSYKATIVVQGTGNVQGDSLILDRSGAELWMSVLIVAPLALFTTTWVLDRRLTRSRVGRSRKR